MLATLGPLPREDGSWVYEVKWDGVRAVCSAAGGDLCIRSRSGRDITRSWPELAGLPAALGGRDAVLDGEMVAFDPDTGLPSFQVLQGRIHLASRYAIEAAAVDTPINLVLFDLLSLDGESLLARPYTERRAALEELPLGPGPWTVPAVHDDGAALLAATRERGLEGVVAKKRTSPYLPGRRVPFWVKVKNVQRVVLTIGGWLPGEGRRSDRFGAVVVGERLDDGTLRYAGRVGSGFDEAQLTDMRARLAALERPSSPFTGRQPPKETRYVAPVLRCDVEFLEWSRTRTLRAPVYKGLVEG